MPGEEEDGEEGARGGEGVQMAGHCLARPRAVMAQRRGWTQTKRSNKNQTTYENRGKKEACHPLLGSCPIPRAPETLRSPPKPTAGQGGERRWAAQLIKPANERGAAGFRRCKLPAGFSDGSACPGEPPSPRGQRQRSTGSPLKGVCLFK